MSWNIKLKDKAGSRYFDFLKEVNKNQFMVIRKEEKRDEIKNNEMDKPLVLDLDGLEEEV